MHVTYTDSVNSQTWQLSAKNVLKLVQKKTYIKDKMSYTHYYRFAV